MTDLLLLLLPVAAFTGWVAAKHRKPLNNSEQLSRDYFLGLNFLLNEQPDKAVEVFIKLLEVNSDTVGTHLALGNLFRRQGEVDRAIRIHQNLIARPQLSKAHRSSALAALAKDYLSAGVLDRSERLFLEVLESDSLNLDSLTHLQDIYQQEKSWLDAIKMAQKLSVVTGKSMQVPIAHYYCELSEIEFASNDISKARHYLKQALNANPNCVRSSLISAEVEASLQRYQAAIKHLQQIYQQDKDFFCLTIPALIKYHQQLNQEQALLTFLQKHLQQLPLITSALYVGQKLRDNQGRAAAMIFMENYIRDNPSIRGLTFLLELHMEEASAPVREKLVILHQLLENMLKTKSSYLCHNCGFSSKKILWSCPGCKQWSTIKPILGLEGY